MLNDLLPTVSDFLLILNTYHRVTDHILSLIRQSQMEGKEALANYFCPEEQLQDKAPSALMDKNLPTQGMHQRRKGCCVQPAYAACARCDTAGKTQEETKRRNGYKSHTCGTLSLSEMKRFPYLTA